MYATVEELQKRIRRILTESETELAETLLEDAAVIIDAYNSDAPENAKKIVSCQMVSRVLGDGTDYQVPVGATQGTVSALGYSQTWTLGNGSTGELYLSKLEKKLLGFGDKAAYVSPLEGMVDND